MSVLLVFLLGTAALTIAFAAVGLIGDIFNFYPIRDTLNEVLEDLAGRIGSDALNVLKLTFTLILIIYVGRWLLSWLAPSGDTADD